MFNFCKPISNKKRFSPHRKLNDKFSFTLYENAERVNESEWKSLTADSIFLNLKFLSIVNRCTHVEIKSRYVIVYNGGKPCGAIYFQIIDYKTDLFQELLAGQSEDLMSNRLKFFQNYIDNKQDDVLLRLFTCGNNLISGEHGFVFLPSINKAIANELVIEIADVVSKEEKLKSTIAAVLLKDFTKKLEPHDLLVKEKYIEFFVEPNMVVDLPKEIKDINDYIQLFSKKYRNRARSILKSGQDLKCRKLDLNEIQSNEDKIHELYSDVYNAAKFKLLKLPKGYFTEIKKLFPEKFFMSGFYLNNELIAFSSQFLINKSCVEAHYIGFKYELNSDYDLYQNILYNNIQFAIDNKRQNVNLGRTAAEIKTTVGAKPVDLICYIKPRNTFSKLVMKPLIGFLQPDKWTPRNPFKEEN